MALTAAETAYLQSELGSGVDLADMQVRYDRLGSAKAVALEVIRQRLADALQAPTSFSIPGVYQETTTGNVSALQEQLKRVATEADVDGDGIPDSGASGVLQVQKLRRRRARS